MHDVDSSAPPRQTRCPVSGFSHKYCIIQNIKKEMLCCASLGTNGIWRRLLQSPPHNPAQDRETWRQQKWRMRTDKMLMEPNLDLARLEEYIDTLLEQYTQLQADYRTLQNKLRAQGGELQGFKDNMQQLEAEREEMGGRVAKLLNRIERWQQEQPLPTPSHGGSLAESPLPADSD